MKTSVSNRIRHFFHVVSNVRPIIWICLYIALIPIFALIYHWLPDNQFRIPDNAPTDYGSWLYYSIVTITTLGFGDYTPAMGGAQAVTAIEVGCGLLILGFFLNAVGSMKSEIDVESALEKQKMLHNAQEKEKLLKSTPMLIHNLNLFLAYCYAVTTPLKQRTNPQSPSYNPDFKFNDMADLYQPSMLPIDYTKSPAVEGLLKATARTVLCLDSVQNRIDLTLWPDLLEDCFSFVAEYQMFTTSDALGERLDLEIREGKELSLSPSDRNISDEIRNFSGDPADSRDPGNLKPYFDLYNFIKKTASLATSMETELTSIASRPLTETEG